MSFYMFQMWFSSYWSLLIIFIGLIVAYEVIVLAYQLVCNWRKESKEEVLLFNELGGQCAKEHIKASLKGQVFHCSNKYCTHVHVNRIIDHLNNAKFSIDLAMYTLGSIEITNALKNALLRNVAVRIIVSQRREAFNYLLLDLMDWGAQVRSQSSINFMQHRFCVIDEQGRVDRLWYKKNINGPKSNSVFMNGSLNWTDSGTGGNWENVIITTNEQLAKAFQAEFDRMWKVFST
ncbi:mitochondrial cardiolipin hydrolase-like, partial [Drosophila navojoa]|uniref:mitochondrial cardiolipin hydrolase-like n=1 Tax=Drosophila navojoa TaxID=7232 RepID=UPI0011BE547A